MIHVSNPLNRCYTLLIKKIPALEPLKNHPHTRNLPSTFHPT
jgi:hypothetical protein